MIEWTDEDADTARKCGWSISRPTGSTQLQITKLRSDESNIRYVMERALDGNHLARKAILYIMQESESDL